MKRMLTNIRMGLALPIALLAASITWGEECNYIDENGEQKSSTCTVLNSAYLSEYYGDISRNKSIEWFIVPASFEYTGSISSVGNINLVLGDGATFTLNYSSGNSAISTTSSNINIFGQKLQTGTLIVNETGNSESNRIAISAGGSSSIHIAGGRVSVNSLRSDNTAMSASTIAVHGGSLKANGMFTTLSIFMVDTISFGGITNSFTNSSNLTFRQANDGKKFVCKGGPSNSESSCSSDIMKGKTLVTDYLLLNLNYVEYDGTGHRVILNGEHDGNRILNGVVEDKDVRSIDFRRKFTSNAPATIFLPFTLPSGASVNAKFYRLYSVAQDGCSWLAQFADIRKKSIWGDEAYTLPKAYTPYMIVPEDEKLIFNLNGQTAILAELKEVSEKHDTLVETKNYTDKKWRFNGVYSYKTWLENDDELGFAYAFAATDNLGGARTGEFGKVASGGTALPFRAYLLKESNFKLDPERCSSCPPNAQRPAALSKSVVDVSGIPETINVELIDEDENGEHTTFVGRMNTRTGEFEMLHDYDLKGRKLNGAPKARGAYYGKKVLKK